MASRFLLLLIAPRQGEEGMFTKNTQSMRRLIYLGAIAGVWGFNKCRKFFFSYKGEELCLLAVAEERV